MIPGHFPRASDLPITMGNQIGILSIEKGI